MAIEDAEHMLRQFEHRIEEQLAQAGRLKAEMELVTATAQSRDGDVEVTVDSNGGLSDLYLSQAALRRSPGDLAAELLTVSRSAQAQLAEKMSRTMTAVLGPGSETAQFVTETYAERFTAPTEHDGPAQPGRQAGDIR